jgi:hypothetical protein
VMSHILQVNGLCRGCCAKDKGAGADRHPRNLKAGLQ